MHAPGTLDPLKEISLDYSDPKVRKNTRMDAQLASLKVKRRTRFEAMPVKQRSNSIVETPDKSPIGKMERINTSTLKSTAENDTASKNEEAKSLERKLSTVKSEKFDIFKAKL